MDRASLEGRTLEYEVRGDGEPVVFIHGAHIADAFVPLDEVLAIGTSQGVVKRVQPDYPLNREDWDVIALKDKDFVVNVAPAGADDAELVFLTSQAQLLKFGAASVRPQRKNRLSPVGAGGPKSVPEVGVVSR